jgi:dihydroorotate dehydrogenase electron transfer subunit
MKLASARIISNSEILPQIYLMRVRAPVIAALATPGQYVMVRCGGGHDMPLRRPLGIHRIYQDGIALLFTVVGRGTAWLSERKAGEQVDLFGPLGKGFEIHPSSRSLLLVAGGVGVAPLVALAESAMSKGISVILLIGEKSSAKIYPSHLLPSGIEPVVTTEDGSLGQKGVITDILPQFIPEADQIFACGPLPMYRAMAKMSSKFGNKPVYVLLETVMGCGVGACLSCSIETKHERKLVCKDGPVFELNDIVWEKIVAPASGGRYQKR